ncbi:hypothetical protein ACHAWF_009603 [Thalassiosira exigua]
MANQKICKCCNLTTERTQRVLAIDCAVRGNPSLVGSLDGMVTEEVMAGPNRVLCESCSIKTDTALRFGIVDLPELLTFDLKRFDLGYQTFETVKLDSRYEFPETLDMKPFFIASQEERQHQYHGFKYRLVGVVVHQGTASGGHYFSLSRERGPAGRWLRFADERVEVVSSSVIEPLCFGRDTQAGLPSTNARILFYERIGE